MFASKAVKSSLCLKNRHICEYILTKSPVFTLLETPKGKFTAPSRRATNLNQRKKTYGETY